MAMVVKNNMSAVRTLNTLNSNTSALQKSLQKVSSGMKINSAQDDASGYAISERMRVRIRSLDQANQNSQNDSSLMKTAEGAVGNTVEILRALKEKAINAANDSNTDEDRQTIQKEINQFIDQIDDNALVQFNGKYLVDGSKNNATQDTKTILLNQSLQKGTKAASALTDLNNRAGDSLGIQTTDKYQVSWVQNGSIQFTSGDVGENTIKDILTLKGTAMTVDSDGKKDYIDDTDISQVSATAPEGLISGEADDTNTTDKYLEVFKYDSETAYDTDNELIALAKAKIDDANDTDVSTVGSNKVVQLNKIVDSDGMGYYASYNGTDGTAFDDTVTVEYDTAQDKYSFTGLTQNAPVYKQNVHYDSSGDPHEVTTYEEAYTYNGTIAAGDALATAFNDKVSMPSPPAEGTATYKLSELGFYKDSTGAEFGPTDIVTRTITYNDPNFDTTFTVTGLTSGNKLYVKDTHMETPDPVAASEKGLEDASDKFGKAVYTPDHEDGVAFGSLYSGVDNQISGLTISILDQDGNVKKAANAALDQFKQYQRAENKTGDMSLNFHIGSEANVAFKVGMGDMRSQALGLKGSDGTRIDVYTKEHANAAINVIENALTKALDQQTTIGAIEARLEYTSTNLTTSSENVQAAESTIRDADMAKEMTNYTKSNVLLQAAQAMLAQANQNSSAVLSLLQ